MLTSTFVSQHDNYNISKKVSFLFANGPEVLRSQVCRKWTCWWLVVLNKKKRYAKHFVGWSNDPTSPIMPCQQLAQTKPKTTLDERPCNLTVSPFITCEAVVCGSWADCFVCGRHPDVGGGRSPYGWTLVEQELHTVIEYRSLAEDAYNESAPDGSKPDCKCGGCASAHARVCEDLSSGFKECPCSAVEAKEARLVAEIAAQHSLSLDHRFQDQCHSPFKITQISVLKSSGPINTLFRLLYHACRMRLLLCICMRSYKAT